MRVSAGDDEVGFSLIDEDKGVRRLKYFFDGSQDVVFITGEIAV